MNDEVFGSFGKAAKRNRYRTPTPTDRAPEPRRYVKTFDWTTKLPARRTESFGGLMKCVYVGFRGRLESRKPIGK